MTSITAFPKVIRAMEGRDWSAKLASVVYRAPEANVFGTVTKVVDGTPARGFATAQEALGHAKDLQLRGSVSVAVDHGDGVVSHYPMEHGATLLPRRGDTTSQSVQADMGGYLPHVSGYQRHSTGMSEFSHDIHLPYAQRWTADDVVARNVADVRPIKADASLRREQGVRYDSMMPRTRDAIVGASLAGAAVVAGGGALAVRKRGDGHEVKPPTNAVVRGDVGSKKAAEDEGASVGDMLLIAGGLSTGVLGTFSGLWPVAALGLVVAGAGLLASTD